MTRWLEAARKAGWHGAKGGDANPAPSAQGFCQVSSGVPKVYAARAERLKDDVAPPVETRFRRVLSAVPDAVKPAPGVSSGFVGVSEGVEPVQLAQPQKPSADREADAGQLADLLSRSGPLTYGAAAMALGWGATRAWRAEAHLRATGRVTFDALGRAVLAGET